MRASGRLRHAEPAASVPLRARFPQLQPRGSSPWAQQAQQARGPAIAQPDLGVQLAAGGGGERAGRHTQRVVSEQNVVEQTLRHNQLVVCSVAVAEPVQTVVSTQRSQRCKSHVPGARHEQQCASESCARHRGCSSAVHRLQRSPQTASVAQEGRQNVCSARRPGSCCDVCCCQRALGAQGAVAARQLLASRLRFGKQLVCSPPVHEGRRLQQRRPKAAPPA